MYYNQYPYNIFNQNFLNTYEQNDHISVDDIHTHHIEQRKNIIKMRKAISDYINASRHVSPDYQTIAFQECIEEIVLQANNDNIK